PPAWPPCDRCGTPGGPPLTIRRPRFPSSAPSRERHEPAHSRLMAGSLDRLECDVASAEALLAEEHLLRELPIADPWHPPAGLGPLPVDLRPRADQVLARQLAVAERLAAMMTGTARQAAV